MAEERRRAAAKEAGFAFHLVKPVDFDEVERIVGLEPLASAAD